MSEPGPGDGLQWAEASRWLAKADEDAAAERLLLAEMPVQAGFHVQRALEKTLKALLIAKARASPLPPRL